jgi:hypothetical protein
MSPAVTEIAPGRSTESGRSDADRHVHEEDPLPRQQVGEDPAQQKAEGGAAGGDRAPDAERLRALLALREGRRDDRQRGRGHERGAQALQRAGGDEHPAGLRQAVQQRGDREDHDADEEHTLAPEEVRRSTAEQQEAAEDERVAVDDPLEARRREVEVGLDRRQGDVRDGRVEHDHELRDADEDEDEPAVGLLLLRHAVLPA